MNTVLAVTAADQTAWAITLVAGLIVAIVVWALLELLRRTLLNLEGTVHNVWLRGKRVEQNTVILHQLKTTRERADELFQELQQHR